MMVMQKQEVQISAIASDFATLVDHVKAECWTLHPASSSNYVRLPELKQLLVISAGFRCKRGDCL